MIRSNQLFLFLVAVAMLSGCADQESLTWYKGNLHTHSLWSDGDDFPEVIADWYQDQGYDFLAISDHNTIADSERWLRIAKEHPRYAVYQNYVQTSPEGWVESTEESDSVFVRLKTWEEYSSRFQMNEEFLMIPAEEVTSRFESKPIHVNASNVAEFIEPCSGNSVVEVMQNNVDAILEQGQKLNRSVMPHINHPNFGWAVRADELAQVEGERFFEVYNGHPSVHNLADSTHIGMERMWDVVNAIRLSEGRPLMFGIGVDDAHHYQEQAISRANAGRGWVMVESSGLTAEELISSMQDGRFYTSSGVTLESIDFDGETISVVVQEQESTTYTIEFFGTLANTSVEPISVETSEDGDISTFRYSSEIGELLQSSEGATATYRFTGEETYVRARITSTVIKHNPNYTGEPERAWTQPIVQSH